VATGLLPAAGPAFAIDARFLEAGWFQGTLGGLYAPEVGTENRDFAFGLTAGWVGGCLEPWSTSLGFASACGKVLLGAIHSVVYVLQPTTPGDQVWGAGSLEAQVGLRLFGPIVAELGLELILPITRQRFMIADPPRLIFQEPAAAGVGFVGLGSTIP
jgi:hypothetical protein